MKGLSFAVAFIVAISGAAQAAERGTADEAVAMTKRAVAAIKADGTEKTYDAITAKDSRFVDRDLYAMVYDSTGKCLAHGANKKLVGRDSSENQDVDGKFYSKERKEFAKAGKPFWVDYKWSNPTTKKIESKSSYCEPLADTVVCVGIYK